MSKNGLKILDYCYLISISNKLNTGPVMETFGIAKALLAKAK